MRQFDGIVALYPHMSIRAVASAIGASPTTVQKYLVEASTLEDGSISVTWKQGLDGKRHPSRRFDLEDRNRQIRQLHAAGQSVRAIAKDVGCSVGTAHRVIQLFS